MIDSGSQLVRMAAHAPEVRVLQLEQESNQLQRDKDCLSQNVRQLQQRRERLVALIREYQDLLPEAFVTAAIAVEQEYQQ